MGRRRRATHWRHVQGVLRQLDLAHLDLAHISRAHGCVLPLRNPPTSAAVPLHRRLPTALSSATRAPLPLRREARPPCAQPRAVRPPPPLSYSLSYSLSGGQAALSEYLDPDLYCARPHGGWALWTRPCLVRGPGRGKVRLDHLSVRERLPADSHRQTRSWSLRPRRYPHAPRTSSVLPQPM